MKNKFIILFFVSVLIFVILGICGKISVFHEFNLELIKKILALFN